MYNEKKKRLIEEKIGEISILLTQKGDPRYHAMLLLIIDASRTHPLNLYTQGPKSMISHFTYSKCSILKMTDG